MVSFEELRSWALKKCSSSKRWVQDHWPSVRVAHGNCEDTAIELPPVSVSRQPRSLQHVLSQIKTPISPGHYKRGQSGFDCLLTMENRPVFIECRCSDDDSITKLTPLSIWEKVSLLRDEITTCGLFDEQMCAHDCCPPRCKRSV